MAPLRALSDILREFDRFGDRSRKAADAMGLFKDIHSAQDAVRKRRGRLGAWKVPAAEEAASRLSRGTPVLGSGEIEIDGPAMAEMVKEIAGVLAAHGAWEIDALKSLGAAVDAGLDCVSLVKAVIESDKGKFDAASEERKIDSRLLVYLAENAARPLMEEAAGSAHGLVDEEKWLQSVCPVCGNRPRMAKLERETGRRRFWCALCGSQWAGKRIECPFCGTEAQKALKFLYLDDADPFRVDVCADCKGYIKVFDERKAEDGWNVMLDVADMVSPELDEIAESRGYRKYAASDRIS